MEPVLPPRMPPRVQRVVVVAAAARAMTQGAMATAGESARDGTGRRRGMRKLGRRRSRSQSWGVAAATAGQLKGGIGGRGSRASSGSSRPGRSGKRMSGRRRMRGRSRPSRWWSASAAASECGWGGGGRRGSRGAGGDGSGEPGGGREWARERGVLGCWGAWRGWVAGVGGGGGWRGGVAGAAAARPPGRAVVCLLVRAHTQGCNRVGLGATSLAAGRHAGLLSHPLPTNPPPHKDPSGHS